MVVQGYLPNAPPGNKTLYKRAIKGLLRDHQGSCGFFGTSARFLSMRLGSVDFFAPYFQAWKRGKNSLANPPLSFQPGKKRRSFGLCLSKRGVILLAQPSWTHVFCWFFVGPLFYFQDETCDGFSIPTVYIQNFHGTFHRRKTRVFLLLGDFLIRICFTEHLPNRNSDLHQCH